MIYDFRNSGQIEGCTAIDAVTGDTVDRVYFYDSEKAKVIRGKVDLTTSVIWEQTDLGRTLILPTNAQSGWVRN